MSIENYTSQELNQAPDEREQAARQYVEQLRAFYAHASVFVLSMAIMFMVNLLVNLSAGVADEWSAWWSAWAFVGWSAGIAVHGLVVRLNRPGASTKQWEQDQIEKVLGR